MAENENENQDDGTGGESAADLRTRFETQLADERAAAAKALAFVKAGIDTDSKPGAALLGTYSGDLTPEAILKEAAEWNLLPKKDEGAPPPPPKNDENELTPEEKAAHAAAEQASKDSQNHDGQTPDPYQIGLEKFQSGLKQGVSPQDAAAGWIDSVFEAAVKGDPRVILAGRRGSE